MPIRWLTNSQVLVAGRYAEIDEAQFVGVADSQGKGARLGSKSEGGASHHEC